MRWLANVVGVVIVLLAVSVSALMLFSPMAGYDRYVLTGTSMTGTIPMGSLVFGTAVSPRTLRRGDIITFRASWSHKPVTHRIIGIKTTNGVLSFQTKGDANRLKDPIPQTFSKPVTLYHDHIPYLGWVYLYLKAYMFFVLGIPALLIALVPMVKLWRQAGLQIQLGIPPIVRTIDRSPATVWNGYAPAGIEVIPIQPKEGTP